MQQVIFIADFIACSICFGHHYAHHQELESIIQMVAAFGIWCFGYQVVGMLWSWGLCPVCRLLQLLMMGILVPETYWASNKICNKYHLLHLVGILFPHINDDAQSESLQVYLKFVDSFHVWLKSDIITDILLKDLHALTLISKLIPAKIDEYFSQ